LRADYDIDVKERSVSSVRETANVQIFLATYLCGKENITSTGRWYNYLTYPNEELEEA
jgi:hypothetical protein